jgi:thiamine-phosphate pyrophosphorylase
MYANKENTMKLVVITNPYDVKNEIEIINRLFSEGLDELHIRKPKYDRVKMKKFIADIDSEYHSKLVLHTHYSLVNVFDIHKIHLGHDWIFNAATNFYLNTVILKGKKVLKSTTITDCKSLYKPIAGINEIMLGPVFAKFTYFTDNQLIKTETLQKALRHSKLPVTALGGVCSQNLEFFKNVGFKGAAMQSNIWKSMDPIESFIEVRDHFIATEQKLRIAV